MSKDIAIPVTSKMILVTKEDMKVGVKLLVMNDHGNVSEQMFRAKLKSDRGFMEWNEKTQNFEWVKVEGDASYLNYLESMRFLFKHKRLLKYKL